MTDSVFPDASTPFGRRVRDRLRDERVIWLTAVAPSGTPAPTPVWFVRAGGDILIYNFHQAARLAWLRERPQVALHLNTDDHGDDVVVLTGRADVTHDAPSAQEHPAFLEKYGAAMERVSGSPQAFSERYSVPLLVRVTKVRGF